MNPLQVSGYSLGGFCLVLANDPALHQLLDSLKGEEVVGRVKGGHYATFKSILNWTGFLILKTLEIAVEVLA